MLDWKSGSFWGYEVIAMRCYASSWCYVSLMWHNHCWDHDFLKLSDIYDDYVHGLCSRNLINPRLRYLCFLIYIFIMDCFSVINFYWFKIPWLLIKYFLTVIYQCHRYSKSKHFALFPFVSISYCWNLVNISLVFWSCGY